MLHGGGEVGVVEEEVWHCKATTVLLNSSCAVVALFQLENQSSTKFEAVVAKAGRRRWWKIYR